MTSIRRIIDMELNIGPSKDTADRLEASIIAFIKGEFDHERRWKGFTTRSLESRLTDPEDETWHPEGPGAA